MIQMMARRAIFSFALLLLGGSSLSSGGQQARSSAAKPDHPSTEVLSPQEIFKRAAPSVMVVESVDAKGTVTAFGSGVVIASGRVVTNRHVIGGGVSFKVEHDGKTWPAKLLKVDPDHDLAELSVAGLDAPAVRIRPSSTLAAGEKVCAIGAPEGLELTISEGVISGLRDVDKDRVIQTSAAISPGSSGGGLFDIQGRLVGITTFYLKEGQSLNFALPAEWTLALDRLPEQASAGAPTKTSPPEAAGDAFPGNYVQTLRATGELPGWANYVCFDANPQLRTSYFLLVGYSPKPAEADAEQAGFVKGITYQEYLGANPLNVPPTSGEVSQALGGLQVGKSVSPPIYNALNAEIQAIKNGKALGVDTESILKQPGGRQYFWISQKYMNATQVGDRYGVELDRTRFQGAELGAVLYETMPRSNVFRTKTVDKQESPLSASLVMQPSSGGLHFVFVQSISGHTSLPISGTCESIQE